MWARGRSATARTAAAILSWIVALVSGALIPVNTLLAILSITRPVARIKVALAAVADGDLTVTTGVRPRDDWRIDGSWSR